MKRLENKNSKKLIFSFIATLSLVFIACILSCAISTGNAFAQDSMSENQSLLPRFNCNDDIKQAIVDPVITDGEDYVLYEYNNGISPIYISLWNNCLCDDLSGIELDGKWNGDDSIFNKTGHKIAKGIVDPNNFILKDKIMPDGNNKQLHDLFLEVDNKNNALFLVANRNFEMKYGGHAEFTVSALKNGRYVDTRSYKCWTWLDDITYVWCYDKGDNPNVSHPFDNPLEFMRDGGVFFVQSVKLVDDPV